MQKANLSLIYRNYGLAGLIKELNQKSKKNRLLKRILEFDRKHFVVIKILKDLAKLEREIPSYGIKNQASKFVNKLKITPAVYSDITNKNFQNQKGILIYGINHSAFIEPIILFSLLNQKRIKLIIFRMYYFIGKNFRKYTLPVATRNYSKEKNFSLKAKLDPSQRFRKFEALSDSQIIKINEKSLKDAAEVLAKGGIVIIFPGGGGSELKKWGFGISKIIMQIKKEKRGEVSLLPVYFSGMGYKRILLRIIKVYKGVNQGPLRVGVYFGKERTILDIYKLLGNRISEVNILKYLREDASSQYGLKEFPLRFYLQPRNYPLALSKSFMFITKLLFQTLPFKDFFKF